jgi:hypothetical protein
VLLAEDHFVLLQAIGRDEASETDVRALVEAAIGRLA